MPKQYLISSPRSALTQSRFWKLLKPYIITTCRDGHRKLKWFHQLSLFSKSSGGIHVIHRIFRKQSFPASSSAAHPSSGHLSIIIHPFQGDRIYLHSMKTHWSKAYQQTYQPINPGYHFVSSTPTPSITPPQQRSFPIKIPPPPILSVLFPLSSCNPSIYPWMHTCTPISKQCSLERNASDCET